MLVDLVELRDRGVKLPREVVLAVAPLRGELSLSEGRPGWHSGQKKLSLLAGLVVPGKVEWAIAPLDYAWVKIIRMDNMVIVGIKQHSGSGRDKDIQAFPQAWWCRMTLPLIDVVHSHSVTRFSLPGPRASLLRISSG